jgi:predicted ATPase/DNA-binding winged helix-turn-helix (wHTH) protein
MSEDFVFGPFYLAPARRELLAGGVPVVIGQRAFDVLLTLVSRPGQLVTKDELMTAVWPGVVVEENNLQVQISALRKALSAADSGQQYLVTVAGRGYRFVVPVERANGASRENFTSPSNGENVAPATNKLPQELTPLIGRHTELTDIKTRFATGRLVTLTGAGGIGKTRLAIEAASNIINDYAGGVWLVELASLNDPKLVTSIIADTVGVSLSGYDVALQALAAALKSKHALLVIDNCEHVISEVARVVETLMRNCPRLSILATSRERLAIPGESVIRVPSLPTPELGTAITAAEARKYAAVQLFIERASALGLPFALTDDNAVGVSSVCRRLDGIPLAIALAVPRLMVMSIKQLERGMDERFCLLAGGSRTALPRQQTLKALIDWSHDLLSPAERLLFARLSVFLGGTTLASIISVTASDELRSEQVGDLLLSLVEKSLVQADSDGNEPRFSFFESTRHYAREKLGNVSDMRLRHAKHFAARLAEAATTWERMPTQQWLRLYGADIDNVRGALEWAFAPEGDDAIGLDLVGQSHPLWEELGLMLEHRHWVELALAKVGEDTAPESTARLLSWQPGEVRDLDDPADYDEAMRAAGVYRQLGDSFSEGRVLLRAGVAVLSPDNSEQSESLLREAEKLVRSSGTTKTLARCLSALASARLFAGDPKEARALHVESIRIYRAVGEHIDEPAAANLSAAPPGL